MNLIGCGSPKRSSEDGGLDLPFHKHQRTRSLASPRKGAVIIGDCKYTPQEVEILPGVLVNNPRDLVLWLRCTHPPTFIPKGQVIAQIIPTRGPNNTPVACPVQAITEERPRVDFDALVAAGFELQEEKVQRMPPWKYLGSKSEGDHCSPKIGNSNKKWVFLSHHRSKRMTRPQELVAELIRKARFRIRELAGCDFECIHIPIGLRSGQISKSYVGAFASGE
ncbi:hypothetical protein DUI87_31438 [Hirundo rustica rustica]|uniref:Uncharacterized protein n=1 Tax=Hirundo rustica rustica TaxID=333673 RepID=A0A3M0IUI5_HIRRU|nr:hypothetical protein DUI87_31438 [Hirundo rustica rustica]